MKLIKYIRMDNLLFKAKMLRKRDEKAEMLEINGILKEYIKWSRSQ